MPSTGRGARRLLLSCTLCVAAAGVAAAGTEASSIWSSGVFNTVFNPVLEPVPRGGLSPPPLASGFSSDFSTRLGTPTGRGLLSGTSTPGFLADFGVTASSAAAVADFNGFASSTASAAASGPASSPKAAISPRTLSFKFSNNNPALAASLTGPGPPAPPTGPGRALQRPPVINPLSLAKDAGKFFARTLRAFSASPAETVRLDLYTSRHPTVPVRIYARKRASLEQSTFDPSKPTKIIIHGFLSHQGPGTGGDVLKNAFLAVQDCNVVTVDWSGADPREYGSAVNLAVPRVASEVAELIRLMQSLGTNLNNVHVLGHSLGGQISGQVGKQVLGPAGAGRITALDPAGPLFENRPPSQRLDASDAGFVDVIHTDGGMLGSAGAVGHVDFFPEGGMHVQPGCGKDLTGICSHCLVYDLLIDAILQPGLDVYRNCSSWQAYKNGECNANSNAVMGIYTDPRSRGSYYFSTNKRVRPELQKAGEKDFIGLLSLRREVGVPDGVAYLRC